MPRVERPQHRRVLLRRLLIRRLPRRLHLGRGLCACIPVLFVALLPVVPLKLGHPFDLLLSLLEHKVLVFELGLEILRGDAHAIELVTVIADVFL